MKRIQGHSMQVSAWTFPDSLSKTITKRNETVFLKSFIQKILFRVISVKVKDYFKLSGKNNTESRAESSIFFGRKNLKSVSWFSS